MVPDVPITLLPNLPSLVDADPRGGRHLFDPVEQCLRAGRCQKREIMEQRGLVDLAMLVRVLQERLDFRAENDSSMMHAVIQRLDTDAIASQPEPPVSAVPQGKGEHPAEPLQAIDAPLLERAEHHLRVGVARLPATVTEARQLGTEFRVVVDFPVEDQLQTAVLVRHRLIGRFGEIDDRQPAVSQADAAVRADPRAGTVRAPVGQRVPHAVNIFRVDRSVRVLENNCTN